MAFLFFRSRFTWMEIVVKIKSRIIRVLPSLLLLIVAALLPATGMAKDKPWKFVVLSDTRSDPCAADGKGGVNTVTLGRIAKAVANEKPDLVLVPGDLVLGNAYKCAPADPYDTQLKNWRKVMGPVYDANIPVLPTRQPGRTLGGAGGQRLARLPPVGRSGEAHHATTLHHRGQAGV